MPHPPGSAAAARTSAPGTAGRVAAVAPAVGAPVLALALLAGVAAGCAREHGDVAAAPVELHSYYDLAAEWRPASFYATRPAAVPAKDAGAGDPESHADHAEGDEDAAAVAAPAARPDAGSPAGEEPDDGAAGAGAILDDAATTAEGPRAAAARGLLFLPAGSTAELPLFVEAGSVLRCERISLRGAGVRLVVTLETDRDGVREVARRERDASGVAVPLDVAEREPAILRLTAEGATDGGVALARPQLLAPVAAIAPAAAPPGERAAVPAAGSAAMATAAAVDAEARRRPPNILVYLVDTLRPDRLGAYGYTRPTSPHLDAFAAQATLFEHALAQSSWTKAAVASIFTGVWPPDHGALGWGHALPASADTLAELLDAAGYRTAAFVTNPNVVQHFGFDQGFDDFVRRLKTPSHEVNAMVGRWLDRHQGEQPFFLYVHTMDPHAPYAPPEPWLSRFAPNTSRMPSWRPSWRWPDEALPFLSDLYDGEIAQNDASFGALLADLEARRLLDDLVLVFVSDHGEEFREHGRWRHGNNLHRETLTVPLVIKLPGQREGRRVAQTVQQIDLLPTLLELAGVAVPPAAQGRSLVPLATDTGGETAAPPAYSHLLLGRVPEQLGFVDGEWKLLYSPGEGGGTSQLYRWTEDPAETRDLAAELPVRTRVLTDRLHRRWVEHAAGSGTEVAIDPELESTMRSLGYLQ